MVPVVAVSLPHAGPGEEPGTDGLVEAGKHRVRARRLWQAPLHPRRRRRDAVLLPLVGGVRARECAGKQDPVDVVGGCRRRGRVRAWPAG
jgi:hypothetical protein